MKKLFFLCFVLFICATAVSQIDSVTYGISALTQGSGLYLSRLSVSDGSVEKISVNAVARDPAGNGRTIDPLNQVFYYASDTTLLAYNIKTGDVIRKIQIKNHLNSTLQGIHYNYRDSTLYGIAVDAADLIIRLATIDPYSGVVTPVSDIPVATSYSVLTGTALDPVHGVYYFETINNPGNHLIGVDLYSGGLFSDVLIGIDSGDRFGPIAYNCLDSTLYGLSGNYLHGRKLARINPYTGDVTLISKLIVADTILNEQATIDPFQQIFYFEARFEAMYITYRGVNLNTGDLVVFSFINPVPGTYFTGFLYNSTCYVHSPSFIGEKKREPELTIFPNPVSDIINVRSPVPIFEIQILNFTGKTVFTKTIHGSKEIQVDLAGLPEGLYILRIHNDNIDMSTKFIKTAPGSQLEH